MNPLWTPSQEQIDATNITTFRNAVNERFTLKLETYDDLHAWSIENSSDFWAFYAEYAGIDLSSATQIISDEAMPHTKWFEGASLNYAQHILYPKDLQDEKQTAVIGVTEMGSERSFSYADLRTEVARCAAALKKQGLSKGDRVSAFATNTPETLIAFLACSSLGVIFSSCSPDFGFEASHARFSQIEPKVLFASPVYFYGAKRFDTLETIEKLAEAMPSVEKTVLLPYPEQDVSTTVNLKMTQWQDFLEDEATLEFSQLPFDYPLYILFSSGTTGLPKAMVHRAGGALLKHHTELHIHSDIKPKDTVLYFSTCGWMMWNWLVSCLSQAAAIVMFEGSPGQPSLNILWELTEKYRITFFGTSARYLHTLQAQAVSPKNIADLSSLRTVASTGSPLSPSGFEFVYSDISANVHLASISGGTDIVGCFMLGIPTKPVYTGQIQGAGIGVDLVSLNDKGENIKSELGELVCQNPLPSMPLKFWNDPNFERYLSAYFDTYPNKWRHGDLIEITAQNGVNVYGRSDATLNPGGVRIGTAEIYRPLEDIPQIIEACAVGKKENGDETIWLFVVLQEGEKLTADLSQHIRKHIRENASPRHTPRKVIQVSQLPRTRSGKAMEIAVSRLVNGMAIPNKEVMANPEAVDELAQVMKLS